MEENKLRRMRDVSVGMVKHVITLNSIVRKGLTENVTFKPKD